MRPKREVATNNGQTYFVTSNTADRLCHFRNERWADFFLVILFSYRPERYLLHAFVIMHDHFHALLTPVGTLERAVQCIKGGLSFRAKRELGWHGPLWVAGFSDHRIRNADDLQVHLRYIANNPAKKHYPASYRYSSATGLFTLDAIPLGLKPQVPSDICGGAEAPPFQGSVELSQSLEQKVNR